MKTIATIIKCLNPNLEILEDRIFINTDSENITYQLLNQKIQSAANHLFDSGVRAGDYIPIICKHSTDYIISILALWILGAVPVPLNVRLSSSELENQINFLKPKFLLQPNSNTNISLRNVIKLKLNIVKSSKIFNLKSTINRNQTAIILFTSGSSGKSKAVELTFTSLISSALIGNKFLNQTSNDCWLASLPFYHIGGLSIIFRALIFGTQIVLPKDLNSESLLSSIFYKKSFGQTLNPSLMSLVSAQMNEILKNNIAPNRNLRYVLLGGGFIDKNLMREALNKGWKVCKVYGSTETSSFVTLLSPKEFNIKPESAGKPISPNEIFIIDENGNQLPPKKEGEIVVKSPSIMKGYFNDEKLTKQKLKGELYFTGDIGYKDEEGYLYVVNRRSDLIVTGGENVNPIEVEQAILKFPKVKEICVFGIDDEKWGQKVSAVITTNSKEKFTLDELKDFLVDKIAAFKIPKEIYFVDALPKTDLGKIRRESVKKMFSKKQAR